MLIRQFSGSNSVTTLILQSRVSNSERKPIKISSSQPMYSITYKNEIAPQHLTLAEAPVCLPHFRTFNKGINCK